MSEDISRGQTFLVRGDLIQMLSYIIINDSSVNALLGAKILFILVSQVINKLFSERKGGVEQDRKTLESDRN